MNVSKQVWRQYCDNNGCDDVELALNTLITCDASVVLTLTLRSHGDIPAIMEDKFPVFVDSAPVEAIVCSDAECPTPPPTASTETNMQPEAMDPVTIAAVVCVISVLLMVVVALLLTFFIRHRW